MNEESAPTVRVPAATDLQRAASRASLRVVETGPSGAPFDPAFLSRDDRTAIYADPTPEEIESAAAALVDGEIPTANAHAVVEHGPDPEGVPIPETGPLSVGTRRILSSCGWNAPEANPNPVANAIDPDAALAAVSEVGLLGRGRADVAAAESVAEVWRRAREADGDPVVVVHANDTDAGVDRLLCEAAAGRVWDGARTVARIVGATDTLAFCGEGEANAEARRTLRMTAIDEGVVAGPERYLVGEPTMALEAIERNDSIQARRRPPGPEEWGLYGRPTILHTPRTLLQVRALLSGAPFDPESADPGTRLVTVRGDVEVPAVVELPDGAPLSRALEAVSGDGRTYAVGGRFGGITDDLDAPPSPPALDGAGLGSEGILEVLGSDRCVLREVGERAAFAREENCGRCGPCRDGSVRLHERLRAIYGGDFDAEALSEIADAMESTSLCAFGADAARPTRSALERFAAEFRAHADGECPAGVCEME